MNTDVIYSLSDPRTNEIRYIGKTKNLKQRYNRHNCISNKINLKKHLWIKELKSFNLNPIMEEIEKGDYRTEMYWIYQMKTWGFNLVNDSEFTISKKLSKALKNKIKSASHIAKLRNSGIKGIYNIFLNDTLIDSVETLKEIKEKHNISLTNSCRLYKNGKKTKTGISIKFIPR